jgi:probable addiction module antidote protein
MTLATFPFDPADHLKTPESQAYLLEDALETGDPAYIADALGIIARARGMTDTATKAGVTREALYKALSTKGDPKLSTLLGVFRALGLRMRLEPIDQPSDQPSPEAERA